MEKNQVIILIPSHNEINTLQKICIKIKNLQFKFVVIDDGSNDGTSNWLKKKKINYIRNKKKIGYENSLILGIDYIIKKFKAKYLITFDADGEHRTTDLIRTINLINKKDVDMIICNRDKLNRLSEYIISFLFFLKFKIKDPLSGFKVYSLSKLKFLKKNIKNKSYLVELVLLFKKNNFVIKNMPIRVKKRIGISKESNFLANIKILYLSRFILK